MISFICPHCQKTITEKDFNSSEQNLNHLKEIFKQNEKNYINQLKTDLLADFESQKQSAVKLALAEKDNQFNETKAQFQSQINELTSQINNFEAEKRNALLTKDVEFKDLLNQKETEISKVKNTLESFEISKQSALIEQKDLLTQKHLGEVKQLTEKIVELEKANLLNKVIQNKTKGENFEHEVEGELRKVFFEDIISKITSQQKKADYLQIVRENNLEIGRIVYEVKNAAWSNLWEKKLVEDMASQGSKYGIIVATSFNDQYKSIPFKVSDFSQNIYLTDPDSFTFVGSIIRTLIKVEAKLESKYANHDNDEKIKSFYTWRDTVFQQINKMFEDQFSRIEKSETSISKQVDEIRIAREKIYANWTKVIKVFIEGLNL